MRWQSLLDSCQAIRVRLEFQSGFEPTECRPKFESDPNFMVRKGGLEPPRAAPPAPKAGASTNSATFASCSRRRQTDKYSRSCALPPPMAAAECGSPNEIGRASCRERVEA